MQYINLYMKFIFNLKTLIFIYVKCFRCILSLIWGVYTVKCTLYICVSDIAIMLNLFTLRMLTIYNFPTYIGAILLQGNNLSELENCVLNKCDWSTGFCRKLDLFNTYPGDNIFHEIIAHNKFSNLFTTRGDMKFDYSLYRETFFQVLLSFKSQLRHVPYRTYCRRKSSE